MERPLPPRPVRPELPSGDSKKGGSWITVALALVVGLGFLVGAAGFLFAAFGMVFPIFVVGGVFGLAGFHLLPALEMDLVDDLADLGGQGHRFACLRGAQGLDRIVPGDRLDGGGGDRDRSRC